MYEAFYGFKEKPFSMLPDPGFLFLSKKHQTALTLLEYGLLNHVGFCVVTGEPGAGKTTIIRALLQRVSENITVGLITNTHQSFGGLLDWVLSAFDLHRANLTSVEMHQIFMEFLIEEYAQNRTVLLVVDEAQNMQVDTLEELRMLSNVNSEKDQLLQVVLSGQPALKEMLIKPELMQFAQRISVDYHLDTLNVEETCGYIQHRLRTAGALKDVFTPAACRRIHTYSGGTPRLINLLCETVLVYGFADQLEMIGVDLVDEMVQERMKDSVVPIVNRDAPKLDEKSTSEELDKDFPWISPKNEVDVVEESLLAEAVIAPEVIVKKQEPVKKTVPSSVDEVVQEKKTKHKVEVAEAIPAPTKKENKKPSVPREAQASVITGDAIAPAETDNSDETRSQLIKYGVISLVFALLLIVSAVMLNEPVSELGDAELIESQEQQREKVRLQVAAEALAEKEAQAKIQAEEKVQQEQEAQQEAKIKQEAQAKQEQEAIEAERAAMARLASEKEKQAKLVADKLAAEQAVKDTKKTAEKSKAEKQAAEKVARKKSIRDEQKRIAIIKAKEKEEKYALERERRKAAKIAEEKRLIEEEDARRLEREWLEKEREQLKALESSRVIEPSVEEVEGVLANEQVAVEEVVSEPKVNSTECSGPTARFKASCR